MSLGCSFCFRRISENNKFVGLGLGLIVYRGTESFALPIGPVDTFGGQCNPAQSARASIIPLGKGKLTEISCLDGFVM